MNAVVQKMISTHTKQVQNRRHLRQKLMPVWGITWRVGSPLVPLGAASCMVQLSVPGPRDWQEAIPLLCIQARFDSGRGAIAYDVIRMKHDFWTSPSTSGKDSRALDPRPEISHNRGKGSWVATALALDAARVKAASANWRLPVIPELPTFYAGFQSPEDISPTVTESLKRDVAEHLGKPSRVIPDADMQMLAMAHWPSLWRSPDEADNTTGMWLISTDYLTADQLRQSPKLFEDFSNMMEEVVVPFPKIGDCDITIENPVPGIADALGVTLASLADAVRYVRNPPQHVEEHVTETGEYVSPYVQVDRDAVAPGTDTVFSSQYDENTDMVMRAMERIRIAVDGITNAEALQAIDKPYADINRRVDFFSLPLEARVDILGPLLQQQYPELQPTALEIRRAAETGEVRTTKPKMQVLYRRPSLPVEIATLFDSNTLRRPHVFAAFYGEMVYGKRKNRSARHYRAGRQVSGVNHVDSGVAVH